MAFSEKLYELRRKACLSQEQLAEQLGVSRQAISKWEAGKAMPESNTLISISNYFNVSLDCLVKEDYSATEKAVIKENTQTKKHSRYGKRFLGKVICIFGIICLAVWGIASVFMSSASDRIRTSSVITVDGNGIFLIICIAAIVCGAVLLFKSSSDE